MTDDKKRLDSEEKRRRNRIFYWALFVIALNGLQVIWPNWGTQACAMVGTVYALYRIVVYDNKRNRYSRRYYNWAGKPLNHPKTGILHHEKN